MQRRASQRGRRAVQVIILPAVGLPVHPICCRQDLRFWSLQEESPTPCQSSPARWATVSRCAQDPRCRRVARLRRASSPAAQSETRWFGPGRGWCLPQDRVALRGRGSRGRPPRPHRPQQPGGTPTPGNNGVQSQISGDNSNQHGADPRRHTPRRAISVQLEPSWAQGAPPPSFRGHPGNDHRHRSRTAPRGHRRSGLPISPPRGASCPLVSSPSVPRNREAPGPASRVGGRLHSVRRPHSALRSAPHTSGRARAQPPRPARHATRPRTVAAVRQQAPGHDPRRATRIRRGPLASGPTRNRRSPPPSHRASGTSIQRGAAPPVSQAAAAPQSRSAPGTQALSPGAKPRLHRLPTSSAVVTLHFERDTTRPSASRHTFEVGPSGAERLSVRHAQLRGHAPSPSIYSFQ
ncbi:hypothetical protein NDU88_006404 [Pleurodeles waltl]|uniref:Uncharacterized protein n=1 Tax=Pleurodeles waltl TaxID=8319 RepID=A0AAV7RNR5_PLEWA|nr:hypothetical protein NDU88_006404 [Pleurodeles waltl]